VYLETLMQKLPLPETTIIHEYNAGTSLCALARKYKVGPETIRRCLVNNNIQRRPVGNFRPEHIHEAVAEAAHLRALGFTMGEIGEKLAVSRQRVFQFLEPLNVKPLDRQTHTKIRRAVELIESLGAGLELYGESATLFDLLAQAALEETDNG
jgi:hypothetical protein